MYSLISSHLLLNMPSYSSYYFRSTHFVRFPAPIRRHRATYASFWSGNVNSAIEKVRDAIVSTITTYRNSDPISPSEKKSTFISPNQVQPQARISSPSRVIPVPKPRAEPVLQTARQTQSHHYTSHSVPRTAKAADASARTRPSDSSNLEALR
jgi:hypothetical protein